MFKLQPFLFSTLSCPDARRTCEDAALCIPTRAPSSQRMPKGAGLFGAMPRLAMPVLGMAVAA